MEEAQNKEFQEYEEFLNFWFGLTNKQQFVADLEFNQLVRDRYTQLHTAVSNCEKWAWRKSPQGRLAEIIVLDQFSRNIYRDQPKAFAQDHLALVLAQQFVECGDDLKLKPEQLLFCHLPSCIVNLWLSIIFWAPKLFVTEKDVKFEKTHFDLLIKFGRFPARNKALGNDLLKQSFLLGDGRIYPRKGQIVKCRYTGYYQSEKGDKFNQNELIEFQVGSNEVIDGWEDTIHQMSLGQKILLSVPPVKAYNKETLVFEIELLAIF